MKIVNFSGKAQAGKTSASNILSGILVNKGHRVLQINYADYLKFICGAYFGWNGKKDSEGRDILQKIGTDKVRKSHPTFWVETVSNFLKVFGDDFDYILIGDCRFINEADYFMGIYPVINIRIIRIGFDSGLTDEQLSHPSEVDLDGYDFDYRIRSESGLNNLRIEIEKLYEQIRED